MKIERELQREFQVNDWSEALRIAAETGCDPRTALKALRLGVDAIRTRKVREEIRPFVEGWRTRE